MRVLVATDGSDCSGVAIDLVGSILWPTDTIIHIVLAVESGTAIFGGPWPPMPPVDTGPFDDDIQIQAKDVLEAARIKLARPDRSIEASIARGRAANAILSLAKQTAPDLIVLGSRGHGTLESMLLGSVSSEVIDHATVPVLIARGTQITSMVLAWDGSAGAERAAGVVIDWSALGASEVHVVSVADAKPPSWASFSTAGEAVVASNYESAAEPSRIQHEQMAQAMTTRLREAGLDASPHRRDGDPATEIVKLAEAREADLVVVGTHGRTGLRRLLMGSVARNVLHHAHCSVLIVHEPARATETTDEADPVPAADEER